MKGASGIKRKDMRRTDWHRILQRKYTCAECSYQGMQGIASVLLLQKVTQPLIIEGVTLAKEGDTWLQLAFRDAYFWVTAMFDEHNDLLQIYFDITNGNCLEDPENPCFDDLYLDIVMEPDGVLHVLDQDELDDALNTGEITPRQHQKAMEECERLHRFLLQNGKDFSAFCYQQMMRLKESVCENPEG